MRQVQKHSTGHLPRSADELKKFIARYNPNAQNAISEETGYFGDTPTLSCLDRTYGNGASTAWLIPQITASVAFVGKNILDNGQVEALAALISSEYPFLKVSEIILFFRKFNLGYYKDVYGSISPMTITRSLREFMRERNEAYYKKEKEEEAVKRQEEKKNAITYEEYLKTKK